MSLRYAAVGWTRFKKSYDLTLAAFLALFLICFTVTTLLRRPEVTVETLLIRGTALAALVLLHVVLCIGPLARLDRRFLPLLFNRRHLGVTMFFLALTHAALALVQFHAFSRTNPLVSLFTAYSREYSSFIARLGDLAQFPFEPMGAVALLLLFLLASTSHDFWLRNLGSSLWKAIHLLILPAYGLTVAHVAWGFLQSERNPGYLVLLGMGVVLVLGLHGTAGWRESRRDRFQATMEKSGLVRACRLDELLENVGHVARLGGRRVALYRTGGRIFALSNVCRHQGGPLGEGRVLDGCITCPWHGWQYRAEDGTSPPPFQEKVGTYQVRSDGEFVYVNPLPSPPGTPQEGAPAGTPPATALGDFFVGYLPQTPAKLSGFLRRVAAATGVGVVGAGLALASLQGSLGGGDFEFGTKRAFEGTLSESPVPLLIPPSTAGDADRKSAASSTPEPATAPYGSGGPLLLVGPGKSAMPGWARGHDGEAIRFSGTLIHREDTAMVEMNDPGSFQVIEPIGGAGLGARDLGVYELIGELVDTKCWLGVMRPSTGKVHRACAVRCLSGGVPPGLAIRGQEGKERLILLAGTEGRRLEFDPQWAGRTVRARGILENLGSLPVLRTDRLELLGNTP
ncbi:MAG: ferric reductase-like transmembrane domain-containing protein [Acidobacteria bacterium]|nr:ferric reductase-like transmembrane domain-containing protein [Acidobacteriota bacterium]MCI0566712.1 ferric reductase-like transmembrane domain-containing protein [Acidobacteriota bacterium]